MLHLTKGLTQNIYFTGTEINLPIYPLYNFKFENRLTNELVLINDQDNLSTTGRYQRVMINVNNYFLNSTTGLWEYTIFDEDNVKVEIGFMYLHPSTNFAPTEYTEQVNTFVTYNGE
jgi:hypothetical protein